VPRDDYTCWRGAGNMTVETTGSEAVPKGGIAPLAGNQRNDFLIDREKQRDYSYTGIVGINQQDMAVTESMGTIYDRGHEHLGTTDGAIIRMRRLLIKAAKDLARGIEPATADTSLPFEKVRSAERIILPGEDWRKLGTEEDPLVQELVVEAMPAS
jgi:hypothetical protein